MPGHQEGVRLGLGGTSGEEKEEDLSAEILALLERQRRSRLKAAEDRRQQRIAAAGGGMHDAVLRETYANAQSRPKSAGATRPKSRSGGPPRGESPRIDPEAIEAMLATVQLSDDDDSDDRSREGKQRVTRHRGVSPGPAAAAPMRGPPLALLLSPQRGKLRPKSASSARRKKDNFETQNLDESLEADVNEILRKKLSSKKRPQSEKRPELALNLGPVWDLSLLTGGAAVLLGEGGDSDSVGGGTGSARRAKSAAPLGAVVASGQMQAQLTGRSSSRVHSARLPPAGGPGSSRPPVVAPLPRSGANTARTRAADEDTTEEKKLTPHEIHMRTVTYKPNLEGEKHQLLREGQRRAARQQQDLLRQIMEEADLMHAKIVASVEEANFFARQLGLPHRFSMVLKGDNDDNFSAQGYRGSGDRLDRILVQMSSGGAAGPGGGAPNVSILTPDKFYKEHAELHEMMRRHRSLMPPSAQAAEISAESAGRNSDTDIYHQRSEVNDALRIGVGLHDRSIRPRSPPKKPPKPHSAKSGHSETASEAHPLSRKDREAFLQRILHDIRRETTKLQEQCDRVVEMGWNQHIKL